MSPVLKFAPVFMLRFFKTFCWFCIFSEHSEAMEMTFNKNSLVDKSSSQLKNTVTSYFEEYVNNILFLHMRRIMTMTMITITYHDNEKNLAKLFRGTYGKKKLVWLLLWRYGKRIMSRWLWLYVERYKCLDIGTYYFMIN